jgi:hypothetical protein
MGVISTRDFFAGLRVVLALDPSRTVLGDVVLDAINSRIVPELEAELEETDDIGKQEEMDRLIRIWKVYGDKRTAEGQSWNKEGAKTVGAVAAKYSRSQADAEDLASEIAAKFYTENRLRTMFDRYNVETGPMGLMNLWKKSLRDESAYSWREFYRKRKNFDSLDEPAEEGHSISERVPDRHVQVDEDSLNSILAEMEEYVEDRLTTPAEKSLFKLWRRVSEHQSQTKLNWSKDIYPTWKEATGLGFNRMLEIKDDISNLVKRFLKDQEGLDLSSRQWSQLKLGMAERIANEMIQKQFASWMLSGIRCAAWYRGA